MTGDLFFELEDVIHHLNKKFALKDLGELSFFLGLEVVQRDGCLHVSQQKYVRDPLDRAHMTKAKPILTPMVSSPTLTPLIGSPLSDGTLYRRTVGGLQYHYLTRPAVNKVSQFMHSPHDVPWTVSNVFFTTVKVLMTIGLCFDHLA